MKKASKKVAETPIIQTDDTQTIDLLKLEYTSLLGLYTHTENTIFSVFNFYLTLLSAVIGGIVVLIQLQSADLTTTQTSISGLLALTVLIGVIMQDAIVNKHIELSAYALGINLLKLRLLRHRPAEMSNVFFINNFWAKVHPIDIKSGQTISNVHKRFAWLFPLGTHQLFIAVINSLALAAVVIITVRQLSDGNISAVTLMVAMVGVMICSFVIHTTYARFKHQRGVENIATVDGSEIRWSKAELNTPSAPKI